MATATTPAAPLPASLPLSLSLSIASVLDAESSHSANGAPTSPSNANEGPPSSSASALHAESPSLTAQLNTLFPASACLSAQSVARIQASLRAKLEAQEQAISERIEALVQAQRSPSSLFGSGGPSSGDREALQAEITALLGQLETIRYKARQTEDVVKDITGEIRKLDMAKRNLVASMTGLKRLSMLVSAVSQLSHLVSLSRFAEAASALQAIKSLQSSFKAFAAVERVVKVNREVAGLEEELEKRAMGEFERNVMQEGGSGPRAAALADAAHAIDALGPAARQKLTDWYTAQCLRDYRRIFRATDEAGQLDNVSRRYAWFRRILRTHDEERAAAFKVPGWDIGRDLTKRFSDATREDLKSALIREQGKLDVSTLLEALNSTLEFEAAMSKKFGVSFAELTSGAPARPAAVTGPGGRPALTSSASTASNGAGATTLSSVFEPYLSLFVDAQDKQLGEMLQSYRRQSVLHGRQSMDGGGGPAGLGGGTHFGQSRDQDPDQPLTVLPSSTELFFFYRQTLEQCAKLSNRAPFRELCSVFAKYLRVYADEVLKPGLGRLDNAPRRSADGRSNVHDIQRLCLVINTADYCATTSQQLEGKLKERIHPDLAGAVNLELERESFLSIISAGLQNLTRETEMSLDPALGQMLRPQVPWAQQLETAAAQRQQAQQDSLGFGTQDDEAQSFRLKSPYVDELASALEHVAVVVRQDVESKRYVRSWCDRIVNIILTRLTFNVVKLRPLSADLAEQLLFDLGVIRTTLLELPRYSLAEDRSTSAAASYARMVRNSVSRLETLLQVIAAPADDAEALVRSYMSRVGDRSFSNFQKVLDLRGVRRIDQNAHMDSFVAITSGTEGDELAETSFLTSLDMDPGSNPAVSSFAVVAGGTSSDGGAAAQAPAARGGYAALTLGGLGGLGPVSSSSGAAAGSGGGGAGSGSAGSEGAGGAGARAFSDLRRFGSLLVGGGRRDTSGPGR